MAAPRAQTVSLAAIAQLFGVTTESIRLWRKAGMPSRMQSGALAFVPTECIKWRREQDQAARPEEVDDTSKEDKRAILRAERRLKELEVAEREEALVERALYAQEVEAFVGGFVGAVMGRLQQFERDIVQATTPALARVVVERIQDDVLRAAREYADALDASAETEDAAGDDAEPAEAA